MATRRRQRACFERVRLVIGALRRLTRRAGRSRWAVPLGLVMISGMAGCVSDTPRGGSVVKRSAGVARGGVAGLHLFVAPAALNLDPKPGPDAIGLRLYASASTTARGIPIDQGTLEILMYDGTVPEAALESTPPRKVWKFSVPDLRPFLATSSLGVGYQLALSWGDAVPKQTSASVVALYRDPAGRKLYSTVNAISLSVK